MRDTVLLGLVFVASATIGYSYVFRAHKMQTAMARICHKNSFLGLVIGKWLDESPHCVLTLRLMGVFGLVIAIVAYVALLSRLKY
jgi:hypothetical protein